MLARTLYVFVRILYVLLLARILMSWFRPRYRTKSNAWFFSIEELVWRATEPLLAPIRNILPQTGGWDLSPLVLFILISMVSRWLFPML
ncbi:MAG TPA: YggT family protein [Symbiobacteriaceae bacterium]|nr:YggT family protein [Symbiobacteriaceae bacterium]